VHLSSRGGRAAVVLASLAALAAGCGGSGGAATTATGSGAPKNVSRATTAARTAAPPLTPAQRALGLPALPRGPVPGYLMIADRDNNRILIVDPATKRIVWRFPRPGDVRPGQSFHDPDDAFFAPGYRDLSTNEEFNQSIAEIDLRTHRIVWSYGHPGVRGSAPGYLSSPDDAYMLPNGSFMVADIANCRVLFISRAKKVTREIGHAGACGHDPPRGLSSPNGATPLPDGGVLVTEIGGWVDRISRAGRLVYSVRTPTTYPSDAQLLPGGNILVAGYDDPGRVDEITPSGRIVWTFAPNGYWSLDRPSLAVRWPNGMIAITDDWHHRVLVVDPRTKRVVWSYGHLNRPGSAPGYLDKPDGLDLLPAVASRTPARSPARRTSVVRGLRVTRVGSLPQALSKASAVALPGGRLMVLGGYAGGASLDAILLGAPAHLRAVGRLPVPTHDAAAAVLGGAVYLFGGGQAVSEATVVRVDAGSGKASRAPALDEPLSDLGAVAIGGRAYLVGGYTGSRFASALLQYLPGGGTKTVARLPAGTRYAGVTAIGRTIYVAGGLTTAGPTDAVYAVRPGGRARRIGTLPAPEDHAALAALGGELYLVGGSRVLRIDPSTGRVSTAARLPAALTDPTATTLGDAILVAGGGTDAVYELHR
jgi:DNA-binding beta-propeller fold protein YncE